jgi:hypothetical protein
MTKNLASLAAGVVALAVASSPALATSNRTFVSGTGNDAGTCAITAPCRTFAYALTQTAASGEIIVLSSGGYGSVTIGQPVSIINTSNFAGITVASGNGITINAGVNDSVVLRGISVDGGGTGANGIVFNSGGKLTIDQCNVSNFVGASSNIGNGIVLQPGAGSSRIIITNTTAINNQIVGVNYLPSGTAAGGIVIDHLSADNNGYGFQFINNSSGAPTASISNSIVNGNTNYGYSVTSAVASLDSSYASGNLIGVFLGSGATLALGRSVLMNNTQYGVFSNGTVNSYKDNRIAGNGSGQISNALGTGILY